MPNHTIAHQRLHNQHISQHTLEKPEEAVSWLCAVQSQDYAAAKWALGLRMQNTTDAIIEEAFNDGTILRTHVMRPTWHFVSPIDIRWLLTLTAPRVNAGNASWYRRLELDDTLFKHSNTVLSKALQGGKQLTRAELASVLQHANIFADNLLRFTYIVMRAELDGVICSGARRGKQFTYALLDERAPQARKLDRDEALAELAIRYFTSHGPATLQDFVWWSGLAVTDAKIGLELAKSHLLSDSLDSKQYWFSCLPAQVNDQFRTIYLLPNFDEYTVGYTDRSAILNVSDAEKFASRGDVLNPVIVLDGRVIGTWKRTMKKDSVTLAPNLFTSLNENETQALTIATNRYGTYLNLPVNINLGIT
jgi:hypothetical protein